MATAQEVEWAIQLTKNIATILKVQTAETPFNKFPSVFLIKGLIH